MFYPVSDRIGTLLRNADSDNFPPTPRRKVLGRDLAVELRQVLDRVQRTLSRMTIMQRLSLSPIPAPIVSCVPFSASPPMTDADLSPRRASTGRPIPVRRFGVRLLMLPWLLGLTLLFGASAGPGPATTAAPVPVTLFAFNRADEASWGVVNDGVMGGRSAGFVVVQDGTLRFTGTLVTQGGGFTSVRARRPVDLTGEVGIELRVRGSGRQFELEVDDGLRRYERSVSRRAQFSTTAEWTLVRVPFSALRSTIFGQAVSATPIDLAQIRGVGLYIADGQDGPFRIEVDYIRSYAAGEAAHDPAAAAGREP